MNIQLRISKSGLMVLPSEIFFISSVIYLNKSCFYPSVSLCKNNEGLFSSFSLFHWLYLTHCQVLSLPLLNIFLSYLLLSKSTATSPVKTTIFFSHLVSNSFLFSLMQSTLFLLYPCFKPVSPQPEII